MADPAGDKSFDPTPHRRQQARQEGHVAKSHDLCSAGTLLLGLTILMTLGSGLVVFLVQYCRQQLGGAAWLAADPDFAIQHWMTTLWGLGRYLLPILGLLCLAGVAVNVLQVGFLFLPERLTLDLNRINPLHGLQRIFSLNNLFRLGFGLLKTAVILAVAGVVIYRQRDAIMQLMALPAPQLALQMTDILLWSALKIGAALFVLAILDYTFQWWKHEQDLKMTPQELREELRNIEGNPQVIARRKQALQETGAQRHVAAAAQADVILIDPAGMAVAVYYDPDTMPAPAVLAKGAGAFGQQIRALAEKRRIAIVEDAALARSLYRHVPVQGAIPAEHYAAVAEVLTTVYQQSAAT